MTKEKMNEALILEKRIRDVKYFLDNVINTSHNPQRGNLDRDLKALVKIKTEKKISIFGSRFFGHDSHIQEILFPPEELDLLINSVRGRLKDLEFEYKNI